jgi:uncharacterized protein DUF5666
MRRSTFPVCVAVVLVVGVFASGTTAQETKSARGTVTAMTADSLTVKAGEREMTFSIDPKTVLTASGAGTAQRQATAAQKAGPTLADFVKPGDAVEVSYTEAGGKMRASNVRRVNSAGSGGGSTSDERAETMNGTVESITATMLTITGSSGGGVSFKQPFAIDNTTKLVATGAGTASAQQGKVTLADFVGVGDQVTIRYRKTGNTLHAEEVRVRAKKK